MAVPVSTDAAPVRTVSARHFVRLKLRVMGNNFRGQGWRIAMFIGGVFLGLWFAASGFFLFALPGLTGDGQYAVLVAAAGGGLLVLGWLLLPLVFFGVDETLDPARFALLPLPRRTLVTGLFAAALVSVPVLAVLIASFGLVLTAWSLGGWSAGLVAVVGVIAGLLLCVAASRAVTSAFATMLRSRRVRDLAAVLLAVTAALLGPLQVFGLAALREADWTRLTGVATVIGWTPFGAPWTAGIDVAQGRVWAAPVKLLITVVALGALLAWWSRSLESAMVGAASAGKAPVQRGVTGGAIAQLFPRVAGWARRDRFGALVAREARYWWRDARRRANLITIAVVGIFVPVMINLGGAGFVAGDGPDSTTSCRRQLTGPGHHLHALRGCGRRGHPGQPVRLRRQRVRRERGGRGARSGRAGRADDGLLAVRPADAGVRRGGAVDRCSAGQVGSGSPSAAWSPPTVPGWR